MSATLVNKKVYKCICELPDCPGDGKPWLSRDQRIPPRCTHCHRFTWNGTDRRVPDNPQDGDIRAYNRKKQAEFRAKLRASKKKEARHGKGNKYTK